MSDIRLNIDKLALKDGARPISRTIAAGEIIGGIFYFNYPGGSGLMSAAVFGRIAGAAAGRAA